MASGYEVVTNRNLWSEIHQSLVYSTLKIEEIKMLGFKYKSLLVSNIQFLTRIWSNDIKVDNKDIIASYLIIDRNFIESE